MKEKYVIKFAWTSGMVDREEVVTVKHWLEAVDKARKSAFKRTRYLGNGVELHCTLYPYKGEYASYKREEALWGECWVRYVSKEEADFFGK